MDSKMIIVSTSLDASTREQVLEVARRHGLAFERSGRTNEAAALRRLVRLGLSVEMDNVTVAKAGGEGATYE